MKPFCAVLTLLFVLVPRPSVAQSDINLRRTVTVEVVERTKNAVVNISAMKMIAEQTDPFAGNPFFQRFGGMGQTVYVPGNSLGSGFIVHSTGYVVTNNHVIERARKITVELNDGRKLPAELISSDAGADLAILKISDPKGFPTLALGDSSDLMPGEPVIAVGNPMGYSHSVSTGIVSATHRDLKNERGDAVISDLIQTDAAINPGNSGGPLLNAYGQVIGINTAIRGDAQNIGFAIQVNKLRDLIPDLMNPAQVNKLVIPMKLVEKRKITPPANVSTEIEWPGAGAAKTRFIDSINGHKPADIIDAYATLLGATANKSIEFRFTDGSTEKITPTVAPVPDAIVQARKKLGIGIEQMTAVMAQEYHLEVEDGLFINEVLKGSVAGKTGIQPGDVLVQFGMYRVSTLDDLAKLLPHIPAHGRVRVQVVRGNRALAGVLEF
jgi:serine protease Do